MNDRIGSALRRPADSLCARVTSFRRDCAPADRRRRTLTGRALAAVLRPRFPTRGLEAGRAKMANQRNRK